VRASLGDGEYSTYPRHDGTDPPATDWAHVASDRAVTITMLHHVLSDLLRAAIPPHAILAELDEPMYSAVKQAQEVLAMYALPDPTATEPH
jgi:hypothetical protein